MSTHAALQIQRPRWISIATYRALELEPSLLLVSAQCLLCMCKSKCNFSRGPVWSRRLATEAHMPAYARYGSFLTEDECDHLIRLAKPHMKDATILDTKTGKQIPNP